MEDLKQIQEFFSKPLEENSRLRKQSILIEPAEIKYTESFGTGIKAPGVLHKANAGVFLGAEGAYIIVLPGGTFYVDEDTETAMPIWPLKDQDQALHRALDFTPFAPEYETWKNWIKRPNIKEAKKLTFNDFVRMVRDDMMAGSAPDERPSEELVGKRAKAYYNDYLQGASVDDLFEAKVDEAYIVTYAKNKGEKPSSAAYKLRGSALAFMRDLEKDGYITMLTQKPVDGVDESVNEGAVEIMDAFNDVMDLVKKHSRNLSDDDSYAFALKLKAWFNKNILDEATKEEETEFHTKLDKLVHDTFGKRKGEMEEYNTGIYYNPARDKNTDKAKEASKTGLEKIKDFIKRAVKEGDITVDDKTEFKLDLKHLLDKHAIQKEDLSDYEEKEADYDELYSDYLYKMVKEVATEKGYSKFLVSKDNPKGETSGLDTKTMNKILMNVIKDIDETIQLGKQLDEKKLCKAGEAYRKRRMAAGEKSSAYLSGRAVKVCKGQMSGKKKK